MPEVAAAWLAPAGVAFRPGWDCPAVCVEDGIRPTISRLRNSALLPVSVSVAKSGGQLSGWSAPGPTSRRMPAVSAGRKGTGSPRWTSGERLSAGVVGGGPGEPGLADSSRGSRSLCGRSAPGGSRCSSGSGSGGTSGATGRSATSQRSGAWSSRSACTAWPRCRSARSPISASWNHSAGSCSGWRSPPGWRWPSRGLRKGHVD